MNANHRIGLIAARAPIGSRFCACCFVFFFSSTRICLACGITQQLRAQSSVCIQKWLIRQRCGILIKLLSRAGKSNEKNRVSSSIERRCIQLSKHSYWEWRVWCQTWTVCEQCVFSVPLCVQCCTGLIGFVLVFFFCLLAWLLCVCIESILYCTCCDLCAIFNGQFHRRPFPVIRCCLTGFVLLINLQLSTNFPWSF